MVQIAIYVIRSPGRDQGATFTLRMPLRDSDAAAAPDDPQRLHTLGLSDAIVLLVEDDADARELTRRILTEGGARVVEAASAREALERIEGSSANVLITDIGMASQDGYQLLRTLRDRAYDAGRLPAIAPIAFARPEDRDAALNAGFQEHLVKPIEAQVLIGAVVRAAASIPDRSLRSSRLRRLRRLRRHRRRNRRPTNQGR